MSSESIFKDKAKLSPHYVPERLVDREDEFRELVRLFKPVLRSRAVQRAFIVGPKGSGRTALVSVFARELEAFAREEGLRLDRAYVDCRWRRTPWQVLGEPFRLYAPRKTRRGLATAELLDEIYRRASSKGTRLVMILDDLDPSKVVLQGDSQLIISQIKGEYAVKSPRLYPLYEDLKGVIDRLYAEFEARWVPRERNERADALSKAAVREYVRTHDYRFNGYPLVECDECGAWMVVREGKYGKFYGCSRYPKCDNTKSLGGVKK